MMYTPCGAGFKSGDERWGKLQISNSKLQRNDQAKAGKGCARGAGVQVSKVTFGGKYREAGARVASNGVSADACRRRGLRDFFHKKSFIRVY